VAKVNRLEKHGGEPGQKVPSQALSASWCGKGEDLISAAQRASAFVERPLQGLATFVQAGSYKQKKRRIVGPI